jgi:hypothetical protein
LPIKQSSHEETKLNKLEAIHTKKVLTSSFSALNLPTFAQVAEADDAKSATALKSAKRFKSW